MLIDIVTFVFIVDLIGFCLEIWLNEWLAKVFVFPNKHEIKKTLAGKSDD